jgi:hypothetical protein
VLAYGPSKLQLMHLYRLENFLHFSERQITDSWQLGQLKWTARSAGLIGLLQELQRGRVTVPWDISGVPLSNRLIYVAE